MTNTFAKDSTFGQDDGVRELYDKLRPGEKRLLILLVSLLRVDYLMLDVMI